MTPISIFRLPQLVFIKIINSMEPAEQLLTALCSRKAYALVKNYRSKAINLTLQTCPHYCYLSDKQETKTLQLYVAPESFEIDKENEKSIDINENRGLKFWLDDSGDCISTCWKDRSVGFKNMLELACDLFRIVHIDSVVISGPEDISTFDWCKKQQITLERLFFYSNQEITDEDFKHVILESTAQQLYIHATPTEDFRIVKFPNKFGRFSCSNGFWIPIDNLMAIDCVELVIMGKRFTCIGINYFLKHWIKGASSRLTYLNVKIDEYNQNELFAGIENYVNRVPVDRVYTSPYKTEFTFNGLQIRRKDGVIASIQYSEGLLFLGVWPDANGNA